MEQRAAIHRDDNGPQRETGRGRRMIPHTDLIQTTGKDAIMAMT